MKIPEQYDQVMPYLILRGAISFREFMMSVFGAEEQLTVPHEDGTLMHGELKVGNSVVMYAEKGGQFPVMNAGLYIHVEDTDATYKKALEAGAQTVPGQEPSDKEYGRTCGIEDPFGNVWWITAAK